MLLISYSHSRTITTTTYYSTQSLLYLPYYFAYRCSRFTGAIQVIASNSLFSSPHPRRLEVGSWSVGTLEGLVPGLPFQTECTEDFVPSYIHTIPTLYWFLLGTLLKHLNTHPPIPPAACLSTPPPPPAPLLNTQTPTTKHAISNNKNNHKSSYDTTKSQYVVLHMQSRYSTASLKLTRMLPEPLVARFL